MALSLQTQHTPGLRWPLTSFAERVVQLELGGSQFRSGNRVAPRPFGCIQHGMHPNRRSALVHLQAAKGWATWKQVTLPEAPHTSAPCALACRLPVESSGHTCARRGAAGAGQPRGPCGQPAGCAAARGPAEGTQQAVGICMLAEVWCVAAPQARTVPAVCSCPNQSPVTSPCKTQMCCTCRQASQVCRAGQNDASSMQLSQLGPL